MKNAILPALTLLLWGVSGCGEETPTSASEGMLPAAPVTVDVRLTWDEFASALQVFGGFGVPADRGTGLLADRFRGLLDARTIGRWEYRGLDELIPDTTGTVVHDTILKPVDTRLVVFFDTLASQPSGPVTVSAHRLLAEFDERTASWTHAVDSSGDRRLWPEAGGGPSVRVGQGVWDRSEGDSLVLPVDSASVRAWSDSLDVGRGFRLDVESEDVRIEFRALELRYGLIPSVNPDTTLQRTVFPSQLTFIYTPRPDPPTTGLRVGGVPAWRSVIHMQIPRVLNGPAELCAALGCPFELTPERVNHASLGLRTRPTDPAAFQPSDTVRVDVRPVFSPERLPRAPLGLPIAGSAGRALSPSAFTSPITITVPVTSFIRAQLEDEPADGLPPPTALALLAFQEPASIAFVSFVGPGEPGEPFLRLILTASPVVELP